MTEMVVAAFDSPSVAEAAIRDLENARIPSADIKSYTKDEPTYQEYRTRQPEHQGGFWSWLIGEEPTQTQEYGAYDTSLASGHTVVTVTVDEVHADAAMGILNQHGPHDIHEQTSGASETYQTGTAAYPAAQPASTSGVNRQDKEEQVIPLAEEELQVGKRTVDRGTTSIRRYVVRKPVEESVTLRDETVTVERRRPVTAGEAGVPAGAFEERTVEVHQTAEEPVVSKTAHIAEEVVVRKDVTERTETVRDDVRREQVEVRDPSAVLHDRAPGIHIFGSDTGSSDVQALGLYVVIFDPCRAKPAMSPFCPNGIATTLCDKVVLSKDAPHLCR